MLRGRYFLCKKWTPLLKFSRKLSAESFSVNNILLKKEKKMETAKIREKLIFDTFFPPPSPQQFPKWLGCEIFGLSLSHRTHILRE